jgi:DNA-binding IclR family transcriptional regulator
MSPPELPPAVLSFLRDRIRSLDELQMFLLLYEARDRWWSAAAVSRDLGSTTGAARRLLDSLAQANLLDIRVTDEIRYQFKPGTDDLARTAREAVDAFHAAPLLVLQQLAGAARGRGLRDFADAFRIRRDDDR